MVGPERAHHGSKTLETGFSEIARGTQCLPFVSLPCIGSFNTQQAQVSGASIEDASANYIDTNGRKKLMSLA